MNLSKIITSNGVPKRTGPDLHRLGGKYPDLWHYKHMIDPRSTSPGSIMPAYPWLEKAVVETELLQGKLDTLKKLGVPYSDEMIANPMLSFNAQSKVIADNLLKDGVVVSTDSEIVAVIAYLQKLGTEWGKRDEGSN